MTKCLSSTLMTKLLVWRNPNGEEKNWLGLSYIQSKPTRIRTGITEISFIGLLTVSVIETIVYKIFNLLSRPFSITESPFQFSAKLLDSSLFTIAWIVTCFHMNFLPENILTEEFFIRDWVGIRRIEDFNSLIVWVNENRYDNCTNSIDNVGVSKNFLTDTQIRIKNGIHFFSPIFSLLNFENTKKIKEMIAASDQKMIVRLVAKGMIEIIRSPKNEDSIFTKENIMKIIELRKKLSDEICKKLDELLNDFQEINEENVEECLKFPYKNILKFASDELNCNPLVSICLKRAVAELEIITPLDPD